MSSSIIANKESINLNTIDIEQIQSEIASIQTTSTIIDTTDEDNKYTIKHSEILNNVFTLSKTSNHTVSGIDSDTCNFIIDFRNYDLNKDIKFKSIELTNKSENTLIFNNLKLSYSNASVNRTLSNTNYYEINENNLFTSSHFINSNDDDYTITTTSENTDFTLSFDTSLTTLNFDINLEYYFETRSNSDTVLSFQHNDVDSSLDNKVVMMKDGSIGIGTDNTRDYSLYVNNINFSKKGIYCADDITILSDMRYKTNIKTIENPIEKLMALRGVSYNRIDRDANETRYGFIAQEVLEILPEACDGENGIKNTDILALLVEAVKEMYKK